MERYIGKFKNISGITIVLNRLIYFTFTIRIFY